MGGINRSLNQWAGRTTARQQANRSSGLCQVVVRRLSVGDYLEEDILYIGIWILYIVLRILCCVLWILCAVPRMLCGVIWIVNCVSLAPSKEAAILCALD